MNVVGFILLRLKFPHIFPSSVTFWKCYTTKKHSLCLDEGVDANLQSVLFSEMEERTGKEQREAVSREWQRERQKDNGKGKRKGGEEREKRGTVSHLQTVEWPHSLNHHHLLLTLSSHLFSEKEERQEEIQQGEERPPVFWWPALLQHTHTVCLTSETVSHSVSFLKQANNLKSNEPCFYCVLVKHSSSSSSSSSSDSPSSFLTESEEVSLCRLQRALEGEKYILYPTAVKKHGGPETGTKRPAPLLDVSN